MQSRQCCWRERDLWKKKRVFPHCRRCWVVQGLSQQPLTTSSAVVPVQQEQLLAQRASTVGLECEDLTSCGWFPYRCATGLAYGVRGYSSTQHVAPFSPSVRRFSFLPPAKLGEKGLGDPKEPKPEAPRMALLPAGCQTARGLGFLRWKFLSFMDF